MSHIDRDDAPGAGAPTRPSTGSTPHDNGHTTLLTRHEGGYAAQGPGFFVWDRDAREVIRIAEALQAGRMVGSRSARFLVIEPSEPLGA